MLLPVVAFVVAQYVSPEQKVKEELRDAYGNYARAVLKHDLEGTMRMLTPDIVWVFPDGRTQKRDEIRAGLEQWENSITKGSKLKFTIEKIKIISDDQVEAWVTLHFRSAEMIKAKTPENNSQWHDTWVKLRGDWKNSRGEQLVFKIAK